MDLSVKAFHKVMKKQGGFEQRSYDLVKHSHLKWKQIEKFLDVEGKTLVDIGAHVGLMALNAVANGAPMVNAVEMRRDASAVTRIMAELNSLPISCEIDSLSENYVTNKADIVMCLGVIHKFPPDVFPKIVAVLCRLCEETLVIETIFNRSNKDLDVERHGGKWPFLTKPSNKYLQTLLENNGFKLKKIIPSKEYKEHNRATWIATRK